MQVASNSVLTKTTRVIAAGVRSTSCNSGWLQLFTHIVCGTFTVTSFILILIVTLKAPWPPENDAESRCQPVGCRVVCDEAPYYEQYEDDIFLAVMRSHMNCQNVFLTLREPRFTNQTLPANWLRELRPVVIELSIVGGNLHHIAPNAFSTPFARNVEILFFERITLTFLTSYAFLGLARLNNILIKDCEIIDMQDNALSAVGQTLTTLSVVNSGEWDPTALTGLSQINTFPVLTTVDFSHNDFGAILGNTTFIRLHICRSLYLSSSRISYIQPGAFDKMISLEYLNLNGNLLKRIEPGLFDVMLSPDTPRVRLNLIDNFWHCDCSNRALRTLIREDLLLVSPTCHSPRHMRGVTFHEFNKLCRRAEPKQIVVVNIQPRVNIDGYEDTMLQSLKCISDTSSKLIRTLVSPFHEYPCSYNVLNNSYSDNPAMVMDFSSTDDFYWIKPLLVVRKDNFSMIELGFLGREGYGLIWYRNSCINDVYCVNVMPDTIRLYNIDLNNEYTFCPVIVNSGKVQNTECIQYASQGSNRSHSIRRILMYPLIAVSCLIFGALFLYMLIRKYPYLLKGSKRLLFVKHKSVDALVLPPKVPLRGVLSDSVLDNSKDLFNVSEFTSLPHDLMRSGSVRSSHSFAPSYISALHPTEEQLTDWRIKHANEKYENHYSTISTVSSDMPISISSGSDHLYFSLEDGSPTVSIIDSLSQNMELKTFTRQLNK